MDQSNFLSGSKVIKQVLTNEVDGTAFNTLSRTSDVFNPGVVENVFNELTLVAGGNSTSGSPSVTVQTGVAYNVNGERILISDSSVPFNSSNPTTTTPDGIGGNTLTPQSTGSANVPLTANASNFVWIDFLDTIDPHSFTLHKVTHQKLFYTQFDGYKIKVGTSAVTPPAGFSSGALLLGLVVTSSALANGVSLIDLSLKPNFGTYPDRVLVQVPLANKSDANVTYTAGSTLFVDDHVKSIGSGTVTANNPHGLSGLDLGINDPGGVEHQKFLHTGGIISPNIAGNASALFMQEHTSGIASENYVEIFPLTADELIVVNGVTVDSTNIPSTLQFSFVDTNGAPLSNGVHTFYVDSSSKSVKRALPGSFNSADVTLQRIWDLQWTNPSLISSSKHDYRLFGTLNASNARFEFVGGLINGLATGNRSYTFSYDTNANVTQVGVGGDNGTISGGITLITYTYLAGLVTQVGASYGHKQLLTTISYSGDTITQITETIL